MDAVTGFIYGMSMMFFSIMAWMFWRKGPERLFRLIAILMLIADAQCLKDIVLFNYKGFESEEGWYFTSAVDMFIIPFYSFVLMELVKPGWTTWIKAVVLELPFVLLPLLYYYSGHDLFFYILSVWGAIYGITTFVVLFFLIRQYHRQLKERFSYQENINLNWLIAILGSFFLILIIWTVSCFAVDNTFDNLYMVCSLVIWMFICYFGYRHESVIDERCGYGAGGSGSRRNRGGASVPGKRSAASFRCGENLSQSETQIVGCGPQGRYQPYLSQQIFQ